MPHYLISGYRPDDFDPSTQDEAMMEEIMEEIHALNREMIAAGVRKLAGGLGPASTLRPQPNGELLLTDGPYLETKSTWAVCGYWNALTWTRRWRGCASGLKRAVRRWR